MASTPKIPRKKTSVKKSRKTKSLPTSVERRAATRAATRASERRHIQALQNNIERRTTNRQGRAANRLRRSDEWLRRQEDIWRHNFQNIDDIEFGQLGAHVGPYTLRAQRRQNGSLVRRGTNRNRLGMVHFNLFNGNGNPVEVR